MMLVFKHIHRYNNIVTHTLHTISSTRVFRFAVVGVVNTIFNFVVLNFSFYELRQSKIVSNVIATGCALLLSFILNRTFVFMHHGHWVKKLLLFACVTIVGTLLVNNVVYILSLSVLRTYSYDITSVLRHLHLKAAPDFIEINGSAAVATLFSLAWNYNGYRKIVFKQTQNDEISDQ